MEWRTILAEACRRAGIDSRDAEVVRVSENAIIRLPGRIVARVSRPGVERARKEIRVARWLAVHGVPAVRPVDGIEQPIEIEGRAVTFWNELPQHRHGSPTEVGAALKRLHRLPAPTEFQLAPLDPFVQLGERIEAADALTIRDRSWLRRRLHELEEQFPTDLPPGRPWGVVHGDPWVGNVVATVDGQVVLLDLERFAVGPPEWDLIAMTMAYTHYTLITWSNYKRFCLAYGTDVMAWPGFRLLRHIREMRVTCWMARQASQDPTAMEEAELRLQCIQGKRGPRPWAWHPVL